MIGPEAHRSGMQGRPILDKHFAKPTMGRKHFARAVRNALKLFFSPKRGCTAAVIGNGSNRTSGRDT